MDHCVITFANTHGAISCEKYLKKDFAIAVMPAPREISTGCGIAVRFDTDLLPAVLKKTFGFSARQKKCTASIFVLKDAVNSIPNRFPSYDWKLSPTNFLKVSAVGESAVFLFHTR